MGISFTRKIIKRKKLSLRLVKKEKRNIIIVMIISWNGIEGNYFIFFASLAYKRKLCYAYITLLKKRL